MQTIQRDTHKSRMKFSGPEWWVEHSLITMFRIHEDHYFHVSFVVAISQIPEPVQKPNADRHLLVVSKQLCPGLSACSCTPRMPIGILSLMQNLPLKWLTLCPQRLPPFFYLNVLAYSSLYQSSDLLLEAHLHSIHPIVRPSR